jgi:hypothetical protein
VLLRRRQQRGQQLAVGGLEPGPLGEGAARLRDPVGELVADPLEVAEPEQPRRPGDALDPAVDHGPGEALGGKTAELAVEPADLGTQLRAGEALVGIGEDRQFSAEQLRHGSPASVDHDSSGAGRLS